MNPTARNQKHSGNLPTKLWALVRGKKSCWWQKPQTHPIHLPGSKLVIFPQLFHKEWHFITSKKKSRLSFNNVFIWRMLSKSLLGEWSPGDEYMSTQCSLYGPWPSSSEYLLAPFPLYAHLFMCPVRRKALLGQQPSEILIFLKHIWRRVSPRRRSNQIPTAARPHHTFAPALSGRAENRALIRPSLSQRCLNTVPF